MDKLMDMNAEELLDIIINIIDEERCNIDLESKFNVFSYDSFTKINIIATMEAYASCDEFDLDRFLLCETFRDVIDMANDMRAQNMREN